jgi:hypothetical protein
MCPLEICDGPIPERGNCGHAASMSTASIPANNALHVRTIASAADDDRRTMDSVGTNAYWACMIILTSLRFRRTCECPFALATLNIKVRMSVFWRADTWPSHSVSQTFCATNAILRTALSDCILCHPVLTIYTHDRQRRCPKSKCY